MYLLYLILIVIWTLLNTNCNSVADTGKQNFTQTMQRTNNKKCGIQNEWNNRN